MAFRKRNVGLSRTPDTSAPSNPRATGPTDLISPKSAPPPGVRPSPVDGRATTSTGTPSLDGILAGHGGLPLGHSLLIQENGTTDSAGALLKFYAAEGLLQGHRVYALGVPPTWSRELPGVAGERASSEATKEKMKIAWRYEKLSDFDARGPAAATQGQDAVFCHTFDLAKRLEAPPGAKVEILSLSPDPRSSPFQAVLQTLTHTLATSPPDIIHRLVIPTLLSPAVYPPHAAEPQHLIAFFHALRSLLRRHPAQLTAMLTLPLELYPRSSSVIRWCEILSDGVLELTPFPHRADEESTSGAATRDEERPQGMAKAHKLPVFHERGGGGGGASRTLGEDYAYVVSRRKFLIKPFNLPPAEEDTDAQQHRPEDGARGMPPKEKLEF